MSYSKWNIKTQDPASVSALMQSLKCSETTARLLVNRGFTDPAAAQEFLDPDSIPLSNPFSMRDMNRAAVRISEAVDARERICIYGDYDVDGITAVSTLYLYLRHFTDNVEYYIPDRFSQGYGVNENAINTIKDHGCSLIITVDTGISAFREASVAAELGVDLIITDHHECQNSLPSAYAVINPKRYDETFPYFPHLAGVGVVYKLLRALDILMKSDYCNENIDLVAVGTIADIMPLVDENRRIVYSGLKKIVSDPNKGLKQLCDLCVVNQNVNSATVGFVLAPRINASGRMESAQTAVELFISDDPSKAKSIAERLCELNSQRQQIENEIFDEAVDMIVSKDLVRRYSALVLWKKGWHNGVIGIVASRLKERYNKPVVLFSVDEKAKGSARSFAPYNIFEAFQSIKDIPIQFGGHEFAAGLLVENDKLAEFRDRLCAYFDSVSREKIESSVDIECVLTEKQISVKTYDEIGRLQPFGKNNDTPLFCAENVRICDVQPTANNRHVRIRLAIGDKSVTGFMFGTPVSEFDLRPDNIADVVFELNDNVYNNVRSVQFNIRDVRLAGNILADRRQAAQSCVSGQLHRNMLPGRNEIGAVYLYISKRFSEGRTSFDPAEFCSAFRHDTNNGMCFEKVFLSIEVLLELGVITGGFSPLRFFIERVIADKKVSLEDSRILAEAYERAGVGFGNRN